MTATNLIILGICALSVLLPVATTQTIQPEFFTEANYTGDIPFIKLPNMGGWRESPERCFNIPSTSQRKLSSVLSNGHCIIIYTEGSCTGTSFKVNSDVASISDLQGNTTHDNFDNTAVSIRFCDETEGWTTLDVELFQGADYGGSALPHSNLCNCWRLPGGYGASLQSVDNHHNCVRLFSSNNCNENEGQVLDILPGRSSVSKDISNHPIYGNVASISYCSLPPACFNLKGKLFAIEVEDEDEAVLMSRIRGSGSMSMSAKTTFNNNGTGTVTQEYLARKELREVIEVEKVTFSKKVTNWEKIESSSFGLDLGVSLPVKKVTLKLGVSLSLAVQTAYQEDNENSEMSQERRVSETTTEFAVRQMIKVPPCYSYTVDSMVTVIDGYPMSYKAFFYLSGELEGERMTEEKLQEELALNIPEYTYSHTVDNFTIVAYATSVISASFGVDTEIVGEGERIQGCYTN